jgi:Ion channel
LQHYNPCDGDDRGGERSTSIGYKKSPSVAAPNHHYDCNRFGLNGGACSRSDCLVAGLLDSGRRARRHKPRVFRIRKLNYATLGYGDVTPVEDWKLLGPITAMNGALMFGWSTAVIFEVLQKTMKISSDIADSG